MLDKNINKIKRFDIKHIKHLQAWMLARDIQLPENELIPDFGLVYYHDNSPAAMAFLRKTEGFAILDNLITNPVLSPIVRDKAVDEVVSAILHEADRQELSKVVAWSKDKNTLERSKRYGFEPSDLTLIIRRGK